MDHILTKSIRRFLLVDSRKITERAAEEIGSCLDPASGTPQDLQGAYTILKRWYSHASARAPSPLWADMVKVSAGGPDPPRQASYNPHHAIKDQ